jgi:hypothetical protein
LQRYKQRYSSNHGTRKRYRNDRSRAVFDNSRMD